MRCHSSIPWKAHVPYAVLAIVAVSFCNATSFNRHIVPPKMLPEAFKFLPARWHIQDSLLGCYKDGTVSGTRDCRWFMSIFILGRFAMFWLTIIALIVLSILLLLLRPFKSKYHHYSSVNATFLILPALCYVTMTGLDRGDITYMYAIILFWCLPLLFLPLSSVDPNTQEVWSGTLQEMASQKYEQILM